MVIGTRNIRAPKKRRGVVDDLVEANDGKIGELHFDDRPHAFDRRADGRADHGIFADGRIHHAAGKFLGEIFGGLECAAKRADVLAVNEHARDRRPTLWPGLREWLQDR